MIHEINSQDSPKIFMKDEEWTDERAELFLFIDYCEVVFEAYMGKFVRFILPDPDDLEKPYYLDGLRQARRYFRDFETLIYAYEISNEEDALEQSRYREDYQLRDIAIMVEALSKLLIVPPMKIQRAIQENINIRMRLLSETSGYVYLVKAIYPENHYKIGFSTNPVKRIESMGVKLPFPIEPHHIIPTNDVRKAERQLHGKYASHRLGGEWFKLDESAVQAICNLESLYIKEEAHG